MMLLTNVLEAEVTPVKGKKGWFDVTGKNVERSEYATADERLSDVPAFGGKIIKGAKIVGMHDEPDCAESDPRFNGESEEDFGVFEHNGVYTMVLNVNLPEFIIFDKLLPDINEE